MYVIGLYCYHVNSDLLNEYKFIYVPRWISSEKMIFLQICFVHYKLCAKIYLFRSSQSVLALILQLRLLIFWIRFNQSAIKWLSLCLQVHDLRFALQYYFSFWFLNLLFLVCWMKTSSLHWWKVKRCRKLEIVAVSSSSSLSLLSLHAHRCIYANNWTCWARSVQARMQVGCHWILLFVLLLAHSSSSSSIRKNRVFYMFSFSSLSCK